MNKQKPAEDVEEMVKLGTNSAAKGFKVDFETCSSKLASLKTKQKYFYKYERSKN
jgi:hypothetical protein